MDFLISIMNQLPVVDYFDILASQSPIVLATMGILVFGALRVVSLAFKRY